MHRRKTSKENQIVEEAASAIGAPATASQLPFPDTPQLVNGSGKHSPRSRVNSVPTAVDVKLEENFTPSFRAPPPSAGPYRTSFGTLGPDSPPVSNGFAHTTSPLRPSFAHSRTWSSSGSSQTNGFPTSQSTNGVPISSRRISMHEPVSPRLQPSYSTPVVKQLAQTLPGSLPSPATHNMRRHSRIHSRNLSVFFPRPGSLPHASIAEDGSQEIVYGARGEAPVSVMPSASPGPYERMNRPPSQKRFGEGFTFGGRTNSTSSTSSSDGAGMDNVNGGPASTHSVRRGHHHKHSMSHNLFSFLEPGQSTQSILLAEREPGSPWNPISPLPSSNSIALSSSSSMANYAISPLPQADLPSSTPKMKLAVAIVQFLLGATLWVSGQQIGSLGCTGLGYWVVFDAFGVWLEHVLPAYLASEAMKSSIRRPYG